MSINECSSGTASITIEKEKEEQTLYRELNSYNFLVYHKDESYHSPLRKSTVINQNRLKVTKDYPEMNGQNTGGLFFKGMVSNRLRHCFSDTKRPITVWGQCVGEKK